MEPTGHYGKDPWSSYLVLANKPAAVHVAVGIPLAHRRQNLPVRKHLESPTDHYPFLRAKCSQGSSTTSMGDTCHSLSLA